MQSSSFSRLSVLTVFGIAGVAFGDINGFGNFSAFTINQSDDRPAPGIGNGWIRLTNQADAERRSIFANTRQGVSEFAASFTYRAVGTPGGTEFGTCFVIQNSAARAAALGDESFGFEGLGRSVALSMELRYSNPLVTATGVYTNGAAINRGGSVTDPVDLYSGHDIDVTIHYRNRILQTSFHDRSTGAVYEAGYFIDIAAAVGSPTAHIGFTAGTGSWGNADQYISNFSYSVPAPGSLGLMAAASVCTSRRRRR